MRRLDLQDKQYEHAMQLNHSLSSDLVSAQLQQLQLVEGPAPVDGEGEPQPVSHSDRALAAFLPAFLRAAMAGQGAPKNGATEKPDASNGVKKPKTPPKPPSEPAPGGD